MRKLKILLMVGCLLCVSFLLVACGNSNGPTEEKPNQNINFARFTELINANEIHAIVQQGHTFFVLIRDGVTQESATAFLSNPDEKATYIHYNSSFVVVVEMVTEQIANAGNEKAIIFKVIPLDIVDGIVAIMNIKGNPTAQQINSAINRLESMLSQRGFVEAIVVRQGENQIRIEVPGATDIEELFVAIGEQASLEFRTTQEGDSFLRSEHVSSVSVIQAGEFEWGVRLHLTNEGGQLFRDAVSLLYPNGTIYIFANGNLISAPIVTDKDAGLNNIVTINSLDFTTRAIAEQLKTQIESGLLDVEFYLHETFLAEYALQPDGGWTLRPR